MELGEQSHLRKLIEERRKRLRVLEVQAAQRGVSCPPEILVEIQDIRATILQLERQQPEHTDNHHETTLFQRFVPVAEPGPPCPYPGMVPFRTDEARFFYGRDAEIKQMLQHLRHQRLLFVIGPSGSGKSSLVLAGLLPRLGSSSYFPPDYWLVRVIRPGAQPLQALAYILGGGNGVWDQSIREVLAAHAPAQRLLLIIDQFEEIFAQASREEQNSFAAALQALHSLKNCAIMIVMRADFYADLMTSELWPLVPNRRLEIATPRGKELHRAIEQPATDQGVDLEEGLVQRLLADAADEPGALPLMQETMVLLWGMMERRLLTLRTYEELGGAGRSGLAVAVANKADAALADLALAQQAIARRIFLRLVQFGEGRADTRRQQPLDTLHAASDDSALFHETIRHLTDNRLLTLSGEERDTQRKVDIAHEALIGGWPMLQRWLAERREAEQTRRRLEAKVAEWVRLGKSSGGLLDAAELPEAEHWIESLDSADLGLDDMLLELVKASRESIRAAERERSLRARTEAARIIGRTLTSSLDPERMPALIVDQVVKLLKAEAGWLFLTDETTNDSVLVYANAPNYRDVLGRRFPHGQGLAGLITAKGNWAILSITYDQQDEFANELASMTGMFAGTVMAVPLRNDRGVQGVIVVVRYDGGQFTEEDTQLLEAVADQAVIALENARRFAEVERSRQDLTNMIIHDLRSPLSSIMSSITMMMRGVTGELTPNQRMILEVAHTSALQMQEMINTLLDISRLESGRMPLELQDCAVRPLVDRAVERLISLAEDRQITISIKLAPDMVPVSADSQLIIRVLQNLLDNAIKYSGRGTAIHISAFEGVHEAHASQHSGVVTIAVRDQGIGIAPENHEKIFTKFGQVGDRRSGTGLGLTFCKLAVEAHGGRIWVESALGAGSTFFFTLPLH